MHHPIQLQKGLGPVVFLGGINAMPMMYALELKKQGIDVLYFVDRPASDTLSRPEIHFQDIPYPYPDWIVEVALPTQILLPLFPNISARWISRIISLRSKKSPQAFVLNGFFCSISPYLKYKAPRIFLPGGSDLDSWADVDNAAVLGQTFAKRSIFKYLPTPVARRLIKHIVHRQFEGATSCAKILYFPKGFNEAGDRVLEKIEASGADILARYDISFEPLKYEPRGEIGENDKLVIFSGVRFLFETFPDGNKGYGKGNDVIIRGLAEYYKLNKNIEIHFVEKGEDVVAAKKLCSELGIDRVVLWHSEMKFVDLLKLYRKSDVCFDQVGQHWIGAIGFYALWLGKPLIANDARAINAKIWTYSAPILRARSPEEILNRLLEMQSFSKRTEVSEKSMSFAEELLAPHAALAKLFKLTQQDAL